MEYHAQQRIVTDRVIGPTCCWPLVCSLLLEAEGRKQGAGFAQGLVRCGREPGMEVLHRLFPVPLHGNVCQQLHSTEPEQRYEASHSPSHEERCSYTVMGAWLRLLRQGENHPGLLQPCIHDRTQATGSKRMSCPPPPPPTHTCDHMSRSARCNLLTKGRMKQRTTPS